MPPDTIAHHASRDVLRRGARVVWTGIREQRSWFTIAVLGSALYGVMTVAGAWAVGKVFREIVTPAVAAHEVTPVSYTHLDVYKRQEHARATGPR